MTNTTRKRGELGCLRDVIEFKHNVEEDKMLKIELVTRCLVP